MQRSCALGLVVAVAGACGPIVPFDAETDGSESGMTTGADDGDGGSRDDGGEVDGRPEGGEVGDVDDGGEGADTGVMAVCGDGIVDPGEICDDGNAQSGDGCELDCTATAGLLLWTQTFDGDGTNDAALAVAVAPSGEILVTGSLRIAGTDDPWVLALAPDGTTSSNGILELGEDAFGTSIAITADGQPFVAGLRPSSDAAVLLRVDGGALTEIAGAPADILPFTALVSPTAEGFVLVTNGGGFEDIVGTVRRYDASATAIADVLQPSGVFVGVATPSADGGTILGGGSFGGMGNGSSSWLAALASDASTVWSVAGDVEPEISVRLRGISTAPDGSIVAVGTRGFGGPMNGNDEGWIWWWTADGQPQSDAPLDIGGAAARPNAVVVGAHGVVVGGTTAEIDDGFVAGFSLDGDLQWGFELAGDLDLEDGIAALAIDPGVGIVAVGWITQSGTNQDAWVGMFSD